jgi:Signal transduction histidine kinase
LKNKLNKTETIFHLFIKTYVELICVLIISLIILIVLLGLAFSKLTENALPNIGLYNEIGQDYENFNTSEIEEMGGSVEVIDENSKVIFRKGNISEEKEAYTQQELLSFNYISSIENSGKLHILNEFTSKDGKRYISIVTLPKDSIKLTFQLSSKYMYLFKGITWKVLLCFVIFITIIASSIIIFSYFISRKIRRPLKDIEEGLISIGKGNYKIRLNFSCAREFAIIKDTFNELLDKLNKAKLEKKQLEESKKRLLADLTHDIKTPITSIKGFSQALVDGKILDTDRDRYYKVINRKSDDVVEMIEELFQYVKMDTPDFTLDLHEKDICEVLRQLIVRYYDDIESKEMELEIDIPDEAIYVKVDEKNLFRALGNLVDNAIKYNTTGTRMKIELFKYKTLIQKNNKLTGKNQKQAVVIRICDNGTGIKNKDIIFDPFVREDESRKNDGGTGLGLSIVKKVIELHGGKINIREDEKYKTIFEVVLYID